MPSLTTCCVSRLPSEAAARPRRTAQPHLGCARAQRQQAVLEQFRAGELNTLISTAVAEEGLDLTRCALVRLALPHAHAPTLLCVLTALMS